MEIVAAFKRTDGSVTPEMTVDEIKEGKYKDYGITEKQVEDMFFRSTKYLIESTYPTVTIEKVKKSERSA